MQQREDTLFVLERERERETILIRVGLRRYN